MSDKNENRILTISLTKKIQDFIELFNIYPSRSEYIRVAITYGFEHLNKIPFELQALQRDGLNKITTVNLMQWQIDGLEAIEIRRGTENRSLLIRQMIALFNDKVLAERTYSIANQILELTTITYVEEAEPVLQRSPEIEAECEAMYQKLLSTRRGNNYPHGKKKILNY